jgi:Protein of unknown function (DUF669)
MSQSEFLDVEFDTATEETTPPFAVIPTGRYTVQIVKATTGPMKNGKGVAVVLNWSITEGEFENRTIFQNIIIQHESVEAQKYGRMRFADVCQATGNTGRKIQDLSVLKDKPCVIFVKIRRDESGQYDDRNEVSKVVPLPAGHNGSTREKVKAMLKEAQKPQPAFEAVHDDLNDELPPF